VNAPERPVRALEARLLRWRMDPDGLPFETTDEVEPVRGIVGQDEALSALEFGLAIDAPGQNVYVRGIRGTGRWSLVLRLLESVQPECPLAMDRCFVYNFRQPDRPRLITLPRGQGESFRRAVEGFIQFVRRDLAPALGSEPVKERGATIERSAQAEVHALTQPFEEELERNGLTLMMLQVGTFTRQIIVPVIDGKPAPPERLESLQEERKISAQDVEEFAKKIAQFGERMNAIGEKIQEIQTRKVTRLQKMVRGEARALVEKAVSAIRRAWDGADVKTFLDEVVEDVVESRLGGLGEDTSFAERYRVNVVLYHRPDDPCPAVVENAPSVATLIGTVDRSLDPESDVIAPQMMIRAGSLLRADGGYLVVDARDLLSEPGAWRTLVRTLRVGAIELAPPEFPLPWRAPSLKPEPIPISVKVVLMGDADLYYLLDSLDPDFRDLFKVLADFDTVMPRDAQGFLWYASILAWIVKDEGLLKFERDGVAALIEHGARIASEAGKLTARFGRLADIAREASFLAERAAEKRVGAERVREAVTRTKRRANLPSRRFRELIARGTIRIETRGSVVGQVNGLAVIQAGPLTYGFPNRLTAAIGAGTAGAINVEREAQLSGAIHTKGFFILGGLLRTLLRLEHPLAFSASLAFEQSYGGVDGDSASGAEACCLLSALTEVPLRQDLAMTGAIDQLGNILPVGATNEKIEGFFDVCRDGGLTGTQGVIVPQANVGELMLRPDVVEACAAGRFSVYGVTTIQEALSLLTGMEPGERQDDGSYPEGTLLALAVEQAGVYWRKVAAAAGGLVGDADEESTEGGEEAEEEA
jgi:predicted ATP-dependent protease